MSGYEFNIAAAGGAIAGTVLGHFSSSSDISAIYNSALFTNSFIHLLIHSFTHSNTLWRTPIINHSFSFLLFAHNINFRIFLNIWISFHYPNNIRYSIWSILKEQIIFDSRYGKKKYSMQHCFGIVWPNPHCDYCNFNIAKPNFVLELKEVDGWKRSLDRKCKTFWVAFQSFLTNRPIWILNRNQFTNHSMLNSKALWF